jgi:hypothetical protein
MAMSEEDVEKLMTALRGHLTKQDEIGDKLGKAWENGDKYALVSIMRTVAYQLWGYVVDWLDSAWDTVCEWADDIWSNIQDF